MDIMVRQAQIGDALGIAIILRELGWFDHMVEEPEEKSIQRVLDRLQMNQKDDSHTVFVAEGDDGRIMGYTSVHWLPYLFLQGLEGYISELFIREVDRGKGIGSLLLESVVHDARERGCSRLMLINMRKRESYHREFYIKKGWVERDGAVNYAFDLLKE